MAQRDPVAQGHAARRRSRRVRRRRAGAAPAMPWLWSALEPGSRADRESWPLPAGGRCTGRHPRRGRRWPERGRTRARVRSPHPRPLDRARSFGRGAGAAVANAARGGRPAGTARAADHADVAVNATHHLGRAGNRRACVARSARESAWPRTTGARARARVRARQCRTRGDEERRTLGA